MSTTAETKSPYTAEQVTAYEAYLSAVIEHHSTVARHDATTKEKMDAAFAQDRAFRRFCEISGLAIGQQDRLSDRRKADGLAKELADLTEIVRSAWSMLRAADAMQVIDHRPSGIDRHDHNACVCLIQDAEVLLRRALAKADGE